MKLLVIGSLNIDLSVETERKPEAGETLFSKSFAVACGGKGANQATAASKLGLDVSIVGCVGKDAFGERLLNNLKNEKVDVSGVTFGKEGTGTALINVFGSDNTIIVFGGANGEVDCAAVDCAEEKINSCDAVLFQLEIPLSTVVYAAKKAKDAGKKVILNPSPMTELPKELFHFVDLIFVNEHEASLLLKTEVTPDNAEKSARDILSFGCSEAVITLGEAGSAYASENASVFTEPIKADAVDTTAAGDTYTAAFIAERSRGKDVCEAMRYASVAAALAVEKYGAASSMPTKAEADEAYLKRFGR